MKLNRKSLRKMILSEMRSIMSEQAGDGELSSEEAEELQDLVGDAVEDAMSDGPSPVITSLPEEFKNLIHLYYEFVGLDDPDTGQGWSPSSREYDEPYLGLTSEPSYFNLSDYFINMLQMNEFPGIDAEVIDDRADTVDIKYQGPGAQKAQMYHDEIARDIEAAGPGSWNTFIPSSGLAKHIYDYAEAIVDRITDEYQTGNGDKDSLLSADIKSWADGVGDAARYDYEERMMTDEEMYG
jgi:hypothetical protein